MRSIKATADCGRTSRRTLVGLLLIALIACSGASVCVAAESETSVACDEGAIPEPITLQPGQHTTGCGVDQNTETDRFRFSGAAGEIVRLTVRGGNVYVDPLIELRGPDGAVVATTGCDTYYDLYACAALVEVTLPQSGTYTAFLRDNGADQTGDYTLQLERLFPTGSRQMLAYGVPLDDEIAPVTDTDVLLFAGAAGTTIRLIGQGGNVLVDPLLSIRDPSGVEIATAGCDTYYDLYTCSFSQDITLPGNGVFAVIIRDNGADQEGTYQLSLECLSGTCPYDDDGVLAKGVLELPGPFMSGINGVAGWRCPQNGEITVVFDEHAPITAAARLPRADTADECDNDGHNGFMLEYNYGLLGAGSHTVRVFDGGVQFAEKTFTVAMVGDKPFMRGLHGQYELPNFPVQGAQTTVEWREELQGFVIRSVE